MADREMSRSASVDRRSPMERDTRSVSKSESPQPGSSRNLRNSSPPRRDYREERRTRTFGRERYSERENPKESRCLGVFGMDKYTKEEDLQDCFEPYGPIEKIQMIRDANTNHSRGYCFIYFENLEDAKKARERCNHLEINGKTIRVDFSLSKRPHSPTPGTYMGNRHRPLNYGGNDRRSDRRSDHRSDRRREGGSSRYDSGYRRDSNRRNERRYEESRYRSRSPRR